MLPRKIGPSRSGVTLGNTVPPVVRHQRGTSTTDLTNMRTHDDVRGLSDEDLCKYIGGWKPGCAGGSMRGRVGTASRQAGRRTRMDRDRRFGRLSRGLGRCFHGVDLRYAPDGHARPCPWSTLSPPVLHALCRPLLEELLAKRYSMRSGARFPQSWPVRSAISSEERKRAAATSGPRHRQRSVASRGAPHHGGKKRRGGQRSAAQT